MLWLFLVREGAKGLLLVIALRRVLLFSRRLGREPERDMLRLLESSRDRETERERDVTETSNESPVR